VQLNFEKFNFQIKSDNNGKNEIYDVVRKKYVSLTPEEWVRQHTIHQLIKNGFAAGRMSIEKTLPNSKKRYDIILYNRDGKPEILVECKAPSVAITQKTLDQVAGYITLQNVEKIILTNGLKHFYIERAKKELHIHNELPLFTLK
jgi:hypothetical protein